MASFRGYVVSGAIWILLFLAAAAFGWRLSYHSSGAIAAIGMILLYGGAILASFSLVHLFKFARLHFKGRRLRREDPSAYAELKQKYRQATATLEEQPANGPHRNAARASAFREISARASELQGLDRRFASRMLVATDEILDNLLSIPFLGLQDGDSTTQDFREAHQWVLAQLLFTFFASDSDARAAMAKFHVHLTASDERQVQDLWWQFEQCTRLANEEDIRSLTAEIVVQRIIRMFRGNEQAVGAAVLAFVGPWDAAMSDLGSEFS